MADIHIEGVEPGQVVNVTVVVEQLYTYDDPDPGEEEREEEQPKPLRAVAGRKGE